MRRSSSKQPRAMLALCITPPSFRMHNSIAATKFNYLPSLMLHRRECPASRATAGAVAAAAAAAAAAGEVLPFSCFCLAWAGAPCWQLSIFLGVRQGKRAKAQGKATYEH